MAAFRRRPPPADDAPSGEALRAIALRLLGRRELSRRQLRERLLEAGAAEPDVEAVVSGLAERGLVDDRRVAAAFARTSSQVKRRGRDRILRELTLMGIDGDVARAAVDEACGPEVETASLDLALRRRSRGADLADPAAARRVFAALLRQGFEPDAIRRALARARGADPFED